MPRPRLSFGARLGAILLLALALRLLLWQQPLHQPANDEFEYIAVAQDILDGRGFALYERHSWLRAPLYPLFLAGSLRLSGGDLHLAALPNILLSVGLAGLIGRIARELDPRRRDGPALLAALLAALLFTAATFAGLYMAETLFAFLLAGALLQLLRWREARGRAAWARVGLAGLLFGLACLTRSAAMPFLPAAMAWLLWAGARRAETGRWPRRAIGAAPPALALAAVAALTIAPWTLRNCAAYGRCVPIETGLAFNLWAFSEPRESIEEIHRTLSAIPNPAERADYATARGLERLREDPAIVLRKLPSAWIALWAVKPIQDRFLLASYYSDPPPAVFVGALLLDDLLGLLILLAAPFGAARALARRDGGAALLALWVASIVGTALLTHAEGRYRHFLWLALIPFAALALADLRARWRRSAAEGQPANALRRRGALWTAGALALAILLPWLAYYPWGWAAGGAARAAHRQLGDAAAWLGDGRRAAALYEGGLALAPSPDLWIALGDLRRRAGDLSGAEEAYRAATAMAPPYPGANARLGDLLRERGQLAAARDAFEGRYLYEQQMIEWSYEFLRPRPDDAIEIGDGLDFGYVDGVFPAETLAGAQARWTGDEAELRLAPDGLAAQGPILLRLRAAAPRDSGAPVPVQICRGESCQTLALGAAWRVLHVALPAGEGPITLRAPTFEAPDGRELGILLDRASLAEVDEGGGATVLSAPGP